MPYIPKIKIGNTEYMCKDLRVDDIKGDLYEIDKNLHGITRHYSVYSVGGWTLLNVTDNIPLKKDDKLMISIGFSSVPSDSMYIYLYRGETQLSSHQCKNQSSLSLTYTAISDNDDFNIRTNSQNFTGKITVETVINNRRQSQVEDNRIAIEGIGKEEKGFFSLERLSPFVRGGNDYPSFNYNTHQVSSREIMKAPFNLYMRCEEGFHATTSIIVNGEVAGTSGWQSDSLYIPKDSEFVMKIERINPQTSEIADISEWVSKVKVFNDYSFQWHNIAAYASRRTSGQRVMYATGEIVSTGGYFYLYKFPNPKFSFVKLHASISGRDIGEIAFYSSYEANQSSYIASASASAGSWVSDHYVYAKVPENCKLMCITSRNIYDNNDPFDIQVFVDDDRQYVAFESLHTHCGLTLFDDVKYIYHFNADRLGVSEIPLNSLFDIDVAHRLGFKAYEINARPTATPGKYVCFHGISGKIGPEIVAKDGTDISNYNIADVSYETFLNDYVYATPNPIFATHPTFLDEALIQCRKYGMIPVVSFADYDMFDYVRKFVGDNFILIIYDKYYLSTACFTGTFNLYQNLDNNTFNELVTSVRKPFMFSITQSELNTLTDDEIRARAQKCHENGHIIDAAGVYSTSVRNSKLFDLGLDCLASGWEVEHFTGGNLLSACGKETFADFSHNGTVTDGVLHLANGDVISKYAVGESPFLSKAQLSIRFNGAISLNMGNYMSNMPVTSDGSRSAVFTTAFFRANPGFGITATGNTDIYECIFEASVC